MGRFTDKTVLVTGGSRGLGRSIAAAFAQEGAYVYVTYRARARDAAVTLETIERAGGRGRLLTCDVRDRQAIDDAVEQVLDQRSSLDVVINNAAVVSDAPFAFITASDLDEVLAVNLAGVFHVCQSASRPMTAQREGVIVNIGSYAGLRASPGQANYAAAKGGVVALTRTIAAELAPCGIRVNAVLPGLLSTGMAAMLDHRIVAERCEHIPLGRCGTAEEVANVVLFVASGQASYLVGQALLVDGGMSL